MPEKKTAKGRKPKEGGGFSPLTIRLPDKTRFALELLAKSQNRSLSQAVEWALNVGVRAQRIVSTSETELSVAEVADRIWSLSGPERVLETFRIVPYLVDFEDRCVAELFDSSLEIHYLTTSLKDESDIDERINKLRKIKAFHQFAYKYWDEIKMAAVRRSESGEPLRRQVLSDFLMADLATVDIAIAMNKQFPGLVPE